MKTRTSRHLLERSPRKPRRSALLGAAGLVLGTILIGLAGTGGSFALWRGSATVQPAAVSAAKMAITQTGFSPLSFTYKTSALTTTAGVQITNSGDLTGNFSSAVTLAAGSSSALASAITVLVWEVPNLASCTTSASSANAASFTWSTIPTLTGTLAAGASKAYCLRTSIPSGSANMPGTVTPTLTTTLTASSWKASATSTATQKTAYVPDTTAPTAPGTPTASSTTWNSTVVSWKASTDAVGVASYDVYRNGVLVANVTSPSYTDTALAASTTYSYTVKARDAANNVSAASGALSVTTPAPPGPDSTLWYQVVNTNSGKCLDASQWGTANGTVLLQWTCGGTGINNQAWQFRPTSGGYNQVAPRHTDAISWDINIDAPGTSGGTTDGTPAQLWAFGNGANQNFKAVALADGTYNFVVKSTGKCLTVKDGSKLDNATTEQRTCAGTSAQAFRLVPVTW